MLTISLPIADDSGAYVNAGTAGTRKVKVSTVDHLALTTDQARALARRIIVLAKTADDTGSALTVQWEQLAADEPTLAKSSDPADVPS